MSHDQKRMRGEGLAWKIVCSLLLIGVGAIALGHDEVERRPAAKPLVTFAAYDVLVDSGALPLAAWQVDVHAAEAQNPGSIKIVGIEGGEHAAYAVPPKYDPRAMQRDRVIIGAFSTLDEDALPTGRTRVARIHVRLEGPEGFVPEFNITLQTAGTPLGGVIEGEVSLEKGERP